MTTIIGISGGSGSGKTTLAIALHEHINRAKKRAELMSYDWYYRPQNHLSIEERALLNFDHPQILDEPLFVEHLRAIKEGKAIVAPQYCFATHNRLPETVSIEATEYLVVESILLFATKSIRQLIDFAIFVDTPEQIRYERRLARDTKERGRTPESVLAQWKTTVKPMHDQFCEPCKESVELTVTGLEHVSESIKKISKVLPL